MAKLFTPHLLALQTAFSDLKRQAFEQPFLLVGTPGSIATRIVNGRSFVYRQYYDAAGKKAADYIGSVEDAADQERAKQVGEQVEVANALLGVARVLSRAGYVRVSAKTDAIVAALANNGLFRAGALIVGSHAYGALLNDLGVRTAAYATEDVDVARDRALHLPAQKSFAEMISDSRLPLHPVPQLDRKKPSTSFKLRGADRLRVDLLVPTDGDTVKILEVRDLSGYATALPYLRYLLQEPLQTVVLGRQAVIPVNVPRPERLAWHKMLVSELREHTSDKKAKDIEQAAVLFAVLAEREPGALEEARGALPSSAVKKTAASAKRVRARLEETGHEQAADLLRELLG